MCETVTRKSNVKLWEQKNEEKQRRSQTKIVWAINQLAHESRAHLRSPALACREPAGSSSLQKRLNKGCLLAHTPWQWPRFGLFNRQTWMSKSFRDYLFWLYWHSDGRLISFINLEQNLPRIQSWGLFLVSLVFSISYTVCSCLQNVNIVNVNFRWKKMSLIKF